MEKHLKYKRKDGKQFWNRIAMFYNPIQDCNNHVMYQKLARLCEPYITQDKCVLELACGTGQLTLPLWNKAASWKATDYSEFMIHELKKRCPPQLICTVQNATSLPYANESFDVVLIANALHIMPHPEVALAEIHRVLTPDGILLAPTFVYERKPNPYRMKIMSMLGFPSVHEWTMLEFITFIESKGYKLLEQALIEANPVPVGFVAAKKIEYKAH